MSSNSLESSIEEGNAVIVYVYTELLVFSHFKIWGKLTDERNIECRNSTAL